MDEKTHYTPTTEYDSDIERNLTDVTTWMSYANRVPCARSRTEKVVHYITLLYEISEIVKSLETGSR